ncbi:MAG: tyrosine-type recombinase/integrase [Phycisphaerales bacterium]|nr:tyrosine-type recombinase/integrase [Phycisphaerales bacterium]
MIPDLQRAGIDPGNWRAGEAVVDFHSFRRGYVTGLVQSGASFKEAQTLARHSDPRLTFNIYTQLGINDGRNAVERAFGQRPLRSEAKSA